MRRYLSYFLILIGLVTIFYPKIKDWYFIQKGDEIFNNWDKVSEEFERYDDKDYEEFIEPSTETNKDENIWENIGEGVDGILNIEKIDFNGPILKEISEYNLNVGVTKIKEDIKIGKVGNYSIAGHRSRRYGRHFNRLGELEKGDEIEVITKDGKYTYLIYETMVVKAEDIWVLEGNKEDKLITLVTCDYSIKPTGRLIVRGKIME